MAVRWWESVQPAEGESAYEACTRLAQIAEAKPTQKSHVRVKAVTVTDAEKRIFQCELEETTAKSSEPPPN